jgi:hypothetical protein
MSSQNEKTILAPSSKLLEKFPPAFAIPIMTQERFAQGVGLSPGVIRGWIEKQHLPTILIGKYRLVNVAKVSFDALSKLPP